MLPQINIFESATPSQRRKLLGDYKSALAKYELYLSLAPPPDRIFIKLNADYYDVLKEMKEIRVHRL